MDVFGILARLGVLSGVIIWRFAHIYIGTLPGPLNCAGATSRQIPHARREKENVAS
jgi:hypothetical protein